MEAVMPIRTIDDKRYKGISELYRTSDGMVTGYYVTYRDESGKPVKRRVEAADKDEALQKLADIKQEIDLLKQGKPMSAIPKETEQKQTKQQASLPLDAEKQIPFPTEAPKPAQKRSTASSAKPLSVQTMQDCQRIISSSAEAAVVMLIDIVAFDDISILYGYETAGRVVSEIESLFAGTLSSLVSDGFLNAQGHERMDFELHHLYADRFCLFVKNDFSYRLLDYIVARLLENISRYHFAVSPGNIIHLNVTIGATKADSSVSLMYAEKALQEAKRLHNSYIFYDSRSQEQNGHLFNKTYEMLLDNIRHEKITPYFQGIFSAGELEKPAKFESLMRLVDREGRILSPAGFLEKSKEYRLYTQLMLQMMEKVFGIMMRYDVAMTLNLSFIDINNAELCSRRLEKIKQTAVGSRLTIEIVESDQIRDIDLVNEFIFKLKKHGTLIAIDDFGSGFSNFDNLLNLELDYVKLDGSLMAKIHDRKHRVIIANMVNICHELGIETVGEYIADTAILRMAQSIGIDYFQGHHLHRPQSWEQTVQRFGYGEADHA